MKKLADNPSIAGDGEAQGTSLANRLISGSVAQMTLRVDNLVVYTQISAGNLSNSVERTRIARQRVAARKREAKGVVIA